MENVKGILSAAIEHRPLNGRGPGNPPLRAEELLGSALQVILEELAKLKYYVVYGLLNCADYGVPQTRLRVVFIGSRDGENIRLPVPRQLPSKPQKHLRYHVVCIMITKTLSEKVIPQYRDKLCNDNFIGVIVAAV